MCVGHVVTGDCTAVLGNRIFGDGVGDELARFILRQVGKAPRPAVRFRNDLGSNLRAVL